MEPTEFHRDVCYRCHKPQVVCVCPNVQRVNNQTGVIILQHAKERFHPVGTVRFAKLGLKNVRVVVHHPRIEMRSELERELPTKTGLLYPSENAKELTQLSPGQRPENLLVLDGTWAQSRALYRTNPWLRKLPHYRLKPAVKSRDQIRKEPSDLHVSTIEAIVYALEALEPNTRGLDRLIDAFTRMIASQIDYSKVPKPRYRRPRPPRKSRALHKPILNDSARVVLAYGEFSHRKNAQKKKEHEAVYWTAHRLLDGARFDMVCRPERLYPNERQIAHMGLDEETIQAGVPPDTLRAAWRRFIDDDALLVVWNKSTKDGLLDVLGDHCRIIVLKEAYCNAKKRQCGALAEVLNYEGRDFERAPFLGRAGRLMGQLWAVVNLLLEEQP